MKCERNFDNLIAPPDSVADIDSAEVGVASDTGQFRSNRTPTLGMILGFVALCAMSGSATAANYLWNVQFSDGNHAQTGSCWAIGSSGDYWNQPNYMNGGQWGSLASSSGGSPYLAFSYTGDGQFFNSYPQNGFNGKPCASLMNSNLYALNGVTKFMYLRQLSPNTTYSLYVYSQGDNNSSGRRVNVYAGSSTVTLGPSQPSLNYFNVPDNVNSTFLVTDANGEGVIQYWGYNGGEGDINGFQLYGPIKSNQAINFYSYPSSGQSVGNAYGLGANATSGYTVSFSSGNTNVCTVSGSTVTAVGTGTCTVFANQSGDSSNWNAAPQVSQSWNVTKGNQTISFGTAPSVLVGGTGTVSATATSGLSVTYTSQTTGVCTISGSTVTGVTIGTCQIAANQSGNSNWNAASQATQNITISKANQTITFGAAPTITFGGTGTVSATGGGSGLPVTFSSQTTGVCTVSGSLVTSVTAGTCTIAANQAGNASYNAATQVTQNITINKANQTISFGSAPSVVVGGTGTVSATASSGLSVTYTSQTTGVCTVSGSTVTGVTPGTCTIAADQAGGINYNAATQVTQNITVGKGSQTLSFGSAPRVVVGGTGTVSATGGASGNAVTFSSTTTGVCTVSGSTVTGVTAGTCTIAADQAGNANYNAATQATQNITVGKGSQTLSFGSSPVIVINGTGTVSATGGNSGNAVTFTSQTTGFCTVSGSTVTGVAIGSCTIAANQAGNANYNPATQVTQTFSILSDIDGDGVGDITDNCPTVSNANQTDSNNDGRGDVCPVYYVNHTANSGGNGVTWATAFPALQTALTYGHGGGGETWVAAGVYYPDVSLGGDSNDPAASFAVPNKVQLLGGFAGTETLSAQRNSWTNRTVLSGDIAQDDLNADGNNIAEKASDIKGVNSYHVLTTATVDATTTVDGFFVTAGYANGAGNDATGGGFLNQGGSLLVSNVDFLGNRAANTGGAYQCNGGNPVLGNVAFTGNQAASGGAVAASNSDLDLTNATLSGNVGGAVRADAGILGLANTILWGNAGGELALLNGASSFAYKCILQGSGGSASWNASFGTDGGGNLDADPKLLNPAGGDVRLSANTSPALNAGLNEFVNGVPTDLANQPRIQDGTVEIGAMEFHPVPMAATPVLNGTANSDIITAQAKNTGVSTGAGDDVVNSGTGRQTMALGTGRDIVVWSYSNDTDIINDFEPGLDQLDIRKLMQSIGYGGTDPLGEGYVSCASATGGAILKLDRDGSAGGGLAVSYALVKGSGVTASSLCQPANFIH